VIQVFSQSKVLVGRFTLSTLGNLAETYENGGAAEVHAQDEDALAQAAHGFRNPLYTTGLLLPDG
jgi:hypothetical protein